MSATNLAQAIEAANGSNSAYDTNIKYLLADKQILARNKKPLIAQINFQLHDLPIQILLHEEQRPRQNICVFLAFPYRIFLNILHRPELFHHIIKKRIQVKEECFHHLHKDIIPLLSSLREKGMKVGLISNCFSEETGVIRKSVLYQYFDATCLSYEQGIQKPDLEIYRRCIDGLNACMSVTAAAVNWKRQKKPE